MGTRGQYRESERIVAFDRAATRQIESAGAAMARIERDARRLRNEALGKSIEAAVRTVGGFARQAWIRFGNYLERRRQYRELAKLDVHQLRDIGLAPGDLAAVADGTFFDDPTRRQRYLPEPASTPIATNWIEREQPGIRTLMLPPTTAAHFPRTGSDG